MALPYTPIWTRTVKCGRYRAVYCPRHPRAWKNGYVYLHRVLMEQSLGRLLRAEEVVHHLDDNGHNNDMSNLELKGGQGDHTRDHHAKPTTFVDLECAQCGLGFRRRLGQEPAKKGYKNAFCSRSCNGRFQRARQLDPVA